MKAVLRVLMLHVNGFLLYFHSANCFAGSTRRVELHLGQPRSSVVGVGRAGLRSCMNPRRPLMDVHVLAEQAWLAWGSSTRTRASRVLTVTHPLESLPLTVGGQWSFV